VAYIPHTVRKPLRILIKNCRLCGVQWGMKEILQYFSL